MRVQLRDCNPPRGNNFKYGTRGRGRGAVPGGYNQRPYGFVDAERRPSEAFGMPPFMPKVVSVPHQPQLPPNVPDSQPSDSQTDSSTTQDEGSTTNSYREWYDTVPNSATLTPPPQPAAQLPTPASSVTGRGGPVSAPAPPPTFYPPWVAPFGPAMQYPIAFYGGFPAPMPAGYTPPPPGQGYSSNNGSDASGPTSRPPTSVQPVPNLWPGMGVYGVG